MVVVDRLTIYAHWLFSHPYTVPNMAQAFVDHIAKLHGMLKYIVSDYDLVFLSAFWWEYFALRGQFRMSTSHHPQSVGQIEVLNRSLEIYLRCYAGEQPKK